MAMFPDWLGCSEQDVYSDIDSGDMQERDNS